MEIRKQYFKEKQYMWHKVRELQLKGLNKTQIGIYLGVNRKTVRRYLNMTMEEFVKKQSSHRKYRLKLENYEQYVRAKREVHQSVLLCYCLVPFTI